MKKTGISFLLATMMSFFALLGSAWGTQASFYHLGEGWLLRAYAQGSNVVFEVRDASNNLVAAADIEGLADNPFTAANDAADENVALAFDSTSNTAYIFYNNTAGVNLVALNDIYKAGGGGTPQINVNPNAVDYGRVVVGESADATITVSNSGSADLVLGNIQVTGTGYARTGGSCANNGEVLTSGAQCTIVVTFTPPGAGGASFVPSAYAGNLHVPSNDRDVDVPLTGEAQDPAGDNIDLVITNVQYTNCCHNNVEMTITIDILNQGSDPAGPFTVKGYFSADTTINPGTPPAGDAVVYTWNVPGLAPGETKHNVLTGSFSHFPIHQWYYMISKVDADNVIDETDESNNVRMQPVFLNR